MDDSNFYIRKSDFKTAKDYLLCLKQIIYLYGADSINYVTCDEDDREGIGSKNGDIVYWCDAELGSVKPEELTIFTELNLKYGDAFAESLWSYLKSDRTKLPEQPTLAKALEFDFEFKRLKDVVKP